MSLFSKFIRVPLAASLLVMALSGLFVTSAFADGETPPPPDGGAPSSEEAAPSSPSDESSDAVPVEVSDPGADLASGTAEETPADILSQVPEDTGVIVVSSEGDELPLASEAAAAAIVYGDPIWCPAGTAPIPLTGGCSASYTTMADLLAGTVPTGNGTIWVQSGAASAGVNIDGSGSWSAAKNYNITIQGGWNGVSGSTALNTTNPYSTFIGTNADWLEISNWAGNLTLNNLIFDSSTYNYVQTSDNQTLSLQTRGNIQLNNVQVVDAMNSDPSGEHDGALLDNTSGNGTITITKSSFNNNEGVGLTTLSNNTVSMTNVTADDNGNDGAVVDNSTASSAKNVTVSTSDFSRNGGDGLDVDSRGAVTANNVSADGNLGTGVSIDNTYGNQTSSVTVGGSNHFNANNLSGLEIVSDGLIALNNLTASLNGLDGVYLDNSSAALSSNSCTGIPVSVNLTGASLFERNGLSGLTAFTSGSAVLNNVTARSNGTDGVYLDNTSGANQTSNYSWGWGYSSSTDPSVSVTGTNALQYNGSSGLVVFSAGSVGMNNINASFNGLNGVYADNTAGADNSSSSSCFSSGGSSSGVSLTGTNVFNTNGTTGLVVYSAGSVAMNNVTAGSNGIDGVYVNNSTSSNNNHYGSSGASVTMTGTNVLNGNGLNGLEIMSDGSVTASNVMANGNGLDGVYVKTKGKAKLTSLVTNGNGNQGIEANAKSGLEVSCSTSTGNGSYGLAATTLGTLTLKGVTTSGNVAGQELLSYSHLVRYATCGGQVYHSCGH